MKRALPLILFGTLAIVHFSAFAAPLGAYYQVMQAVAVRDEATLKYLVSVGLNINATNMQGKTALCTAVENQDYEGYELLLSQGATVRTPCIRNIRPEILDRFVANQPPLGTYYKGAVLTASRSGGLGRVVKDTASTVSSLPYPHFGEILLGGVAVGAAFAAGVHGGGGGGSDSDDTSGNSYVYTAPLDLGASTFETDEYKGGTWSISNLNFLGMVNAADAYARGYTGLVVSRDSQGNLKSQTTDASATDEEKYITDTKVQVAVMDNGQYYNTDLYNAAQTTTSVTGLNYVYGPYSEENNSSYWKWNVDPIDETKGTITLYKNGKATSTIWTVSTTYWNQYSGQFKPICSSTVTSDCLTTNKVADATTGYYTVYYVSGSYNNSVTYTSTNTDATYYILPYMWDLYETTYGTTGYVYDEANAFGKYFMSSTTEAITHGTHVAGIIAALKNDTGMQGVAYNAEVVPVKADLNLSESLNHISDVIAAYPKVKVINLSIGPSLDTAENYTNNDADINLSNWTNWNTTGYLASSLSAAKKNNVALVFSAGNGDNTNHLGLPQSNIFSAAPLVDSGYQNLIINVVALGADKKIASYSNRCGATASYCLAAPGGDGTDYIVSTGLSQKGKNSYAAMMGTSQAAPVVSGSLAVLMGAFPFLSTQQAVQILMDTATYIAPTTDEVTAYNSLYNTYYGTSGVDAYTVNTKEGTYNAIYGRGLVNLSAATSPVGLPKITFDTTATSSNAVAASSSVAHVTNTIAKVMDALPENLIVLDDYSRAYQMSTENFVKSEKRSDSLRRSFRSFMAQDERILDASDKISFAFSEAPADKPNLKTGSMSMMLRPNKNVKMRFGFTEDTVSFGGSYAGRSLQNPFMNMRQAFGADANVKIAKNWALTGSWMTGKNGFIDEDVFDKMSDQQRMQLVESGVAYQGIKNVTLGLSGGIMDEEDSLFGTRGQGAFKTDGAETRFVRIVANYQPIQQFRLSGAYTYGMTEANKGNSLMQFSKLTSDSFALAAEYVPDDKQTFGLKLVSPLRVRSGSVHFNLPVARDSYNDIVYREDYMANLKPTAREYDFSLFYANQIDSDLFWAGETGVRLKPDHQKQDPDYRALFKLNWSW